MQIQPSGISKSDGNFWNITTHLPLKQIAGISLKWKSAFSHPESAARSYLACFLESKGKHCDSFSGISCGTGCSCQLGHILQFHIKAETFYQQSLPSQKETGPVKKKLKIILGLQGPAQDLTYLCVSHREPADQQSCCNAFRYEGNLSALRRCFLDCLHQQGQQV